MLQINRSGNFVKLVISRKLIRKVVFNTLNKERQQIEFKKKHFQNAITTIKKVKLQQ